MEKKYWTYSQRYPRHPKTTCGRIARLIDRMEDSFVAMEVFFEFHRMERRHRPEGRLMKPVDRRGALPAWHSRHTAHPLQIQKDIA